MVAINEIKSKNNLGDAEAGTQFETGEALNATYAQAGEGAGTFMLNN
jgi:hypothetical protein